MNPFFHLSLFPHVEEKAFDLRFLGETYRAHYIKNPESAAAIVAKLREKEDVLFGIDTETEALPRYLHYPKAALSPHLSKVRLLQAFDGKNTIIFDMKFIEHTDIFREFLLHGHFVGHNAVFDLQYFMRYFDVHAMNVGCTMLAAKLVNHATSANDVRVGLQPLSEKLLGIELAKAHGASDWSVPELTYEQVEYAAIDAIMVRLLADKLAAPLLKHGLLRVYKLYKAAQAPIAALQLNGIYVNKEPYRESIASWRTELYAAKKEVLALTGLGSLTAHKLAGWLEENLEPETLEVWPRTDTGKLKTDAHVFADFDFLPIVEPFSRFQRLEKLTSSFGNNLLALINPETSRLHASYRLCGARTGRLSCSEPNLQQCPKGADIRYHFMPEPGNVFVRADLNQIELRVAAEVSRDERMLRAYQEGLDLHTLTAASISRKQAKDVTSKERQMAKACFSGDTEILTLKGWVRFDKYNGQDKVAQYDFPVGTCFHKGALKGRFSQSLINMPFTGAGGEIKFVTPSVFRKYRKQLVYSIKDRNVNIVATGNHDIIYINAYGQVFKEPLAKVARGRVRHLISSGFFRYKKSVLNEWETRILSAVTADGSFVGNKYIRFGFSKRRKYRRLVEHLLPKVNTFFTHRKRRNTKFKSGWLFEVTIKDIRLTKKLLEWVSHEKSLTWACLTDLNARVFLEEAQFWDSHVIEGEKRRRVRFSSTNRQTIDVMQAMCALNGISSLSSLLKRKIRKQNACYGLSYALGVCPLWRSEFHRKKLQRKCDVYCVQVPSGNILIRRNGKVCVQGNCNFGLLFGLGHKKFSHYAKKSYGVEVSTTEAQRSIEVFRETYAGYRAWQIAQGKACENTLRATTACGKTRRLHDEYYYGEGLNQPIQGSAAEILLFSLVRAYPKITDNAWKLVNCVHDEVLLECPAADADAACACLKESMVQGYLDVFPNGITRGLVEPTVGNSWAEAK